MIVVVVSELVVYFFHLSEAPYNVIIMGDIQGGFPVPILPQFNLTLIRQYLPNAITIGLLGFVESIVVAKLYARKNNYLVWLSVHCYCVTLHRFRRTATWLPLAPLTFLALSSASIRPSAAFLVHSLPTCAYLIMQLSVIIL